MPAPCSHKARESEPDAEIPMPRWCNPPRPARPRYKLDDLPVVPRDDRIGTGRRYAQGYRHGL